MGRHGRKDRHIVGAVQKKIEEVEYFMRRSRMAHTSTKQMLNDPATVGQQAQESITQKSYEAIQGLTSKLGELSEHTDLLVKGAIFAMAAYCEEFIINSFEENMAEIAS